MGSPSPSPFGPILVVTAPGVSNSTTPPAPTASPLPASTASPPPASPPPASPPLAAIASLTMTNSATAVRFEEERRKT